MAQQGFASTAPLLACLAYTWKVAAPDGSSREAGRRISRLPQLFACPDMWVMPWLAAAGAAAGAALPGACADPGLPSVA